MNSVPGFQPWEMLSALGSKTWPLVDSFVVAAM